MQASRLLLILGDQLFPVVPEEFSPADTIVWMAEDYELCTHFRYHKHKLILFLSAMRSYADSLKEAGFAVHYSALDDASIEQPYLDRLATFLKDNSKIDTLLGYEAEDHFFSQRLADFADEHNLTYAPQPSPGFITTRQQFKTYNDSVKRPFMAKFYQEQRQRLDLLLDENGEPLGGKWSFDTDNRKKLPKKYEVPKQPEHNWTQHTHDVVELVNQHFADHPGQTDNFWLATTREQALHQLEDFLERRFEDFGPYEDAFEADAPFLLHSILSPYINMGLLMASEVAKRAAEYGRAEGVHYPSVEGFVRQVIGWREFIRGIYHEYDSEMQTTNFFNHQRKLTKHWWDGTTGMAPVDECIQRANEYGYLHHIERLMVMGNVMLLSEIHPDEVNRWFMEFFVDSADWVMVPNVYGMSQFADGGIFATKPYICGANYWSKMSSYSKKSDWAITIDGLYWRFVDQKRDFMLKNPRMSMMVRLYDKMNDERKSELAEAAEAWLGAYTA